MGAVGGMFYGASLPRVVVHSDGLGQTIKSSLPPSRSIYSDAGYRIPFDLRWVSQGYETPLIIQTTSVFLYGSRRTAPRRRAKSSHVDYARIGGFLVEN
jgi:hypothetical protein